MITHKGNYEFTSFSSIEEIEFDLLEEIDTSNFKDTQVKEEDIVKLENIIKNCSVIEFIGKLDNRNLFLIYEHRYGTIVNKYYGLTADNIDTSKILVFSSNTSKLFFEYNPLLIDDEFQKRYKEIVEGFWDKRKELAIELEEPTKAWDIRLDTDKFLPMIVQCNSVDELNKKYEELIEMAKKDFIKQISGKQMSEEQFKNRKQVEENNEEEIYNKGEELEVSINYYNKFKVKGNEIIHDSMVFRFDNPVHKVLPFNWWSELTSNDFWYGDLPSLCYVFNKKEVNYSLYEVKNNVEKLKFKIEFKDDGVKVNGEKIPKAKLIFILKRTDGTKETVKRLKKLTARAIELLDKKEIQLYNGESIYLPFNAETDDGKNFKITFAMRDFDCDMDLLKETFFPNNSLTMSSPSISGIMEFANKLGVEKKELFEHIKRIKLLRDLKDEDN